MIPRDGRSEPPCDCVSVTPPLPSPGQATCSGSASQRFPWSERPAGPAAAHSARQPNNLTLLTCRLRGSGERHRSIRSRRKSRSHPSSGLITVGLRQQQAGPLRMPRLPGRCHPARTRRTSASPSTDLRRGSLHLRATPSGRKFIYGC